MRNQLLTFVFFLVILIEILGCRSSQSTSSLSEDKRLIQSDNNVIKVDSDRIKTNNNSDDEIIFEGRNNLFEIVQKNSAYFDGAHDVIIIKGNNNIIRLVNINVLDVVERKSDTLVIVGNKEKYVLDVFNIVPVNGRVGKPDTVFLKESPFDVSRYQEDYNMEDRLIHLDYFDSLVSPKYALEYFFNKLETGDSQYFFELAELYWHGIGVKESPVKAIELYEYAAAKNYIPSLRKLGAIYEGSLSVKMDKSRARYYYKRGQLLGDSYCEERLNKLSVR